MWGFKREWGLNNFLTLIRGGGGALLGREWGVDRGFVVWRCIPNCNNVVIEKSKKQKAK